MANRTSGDTPKKGSPAAERESMLGSQKLVAFVATRNPDRAKKFYRDTLGFTFDEFFGVPPSFTIVERDDVRIFFRQVRPARR